MRGQHQSLEKPPIIYWRELLVVAKVSVQNHKIKIGTFSDQHVRTWYQIMWNHSKHWSESLVCITECIWDRIRSSYHVVVYGMWTVIVSLNGDTVSTESSRNPSEYKITMTFIFFGNQRYLKSGLSCIFMLFERLLLDFKARWIFVLYVLCYTIIHQHVRTW